jgi:uncharacterized membrane protein YdbT with pleckstrin-like domain
MLNLKHLPNQVPAEEVVHILRRHPFTILATIVGYGVIIAFPFVMSWYLGMYQSELLADPLFQPLIILGVSAVFLVGWMMLFLSFIDYYLDIWIVTTKRILNIEQTGLFARVVSEVRLHRVQDVTSSIRGFWATMLNFGQLDVQTAGDRLIISFEQIPNPTKISKSVLELSEKDRATQAPEDAPRPAPTPRPS